MMRALSQHLFGQILMRDKDPTSLFTINSSVRIGQETTLASAIPITSKIRTLKFHIQCTQ